MLKLKIIFALLSMFILNQALAAEPFHWGINGHPLTQAAYIDVPISTQLKLISELGAGWYRFDAPAKALRTNSKLARFDSLVNAAEQRNIHLLPILIPSPNARSNGVPPDQIRAAAFAYAKAIVSRYKNKIEHWGLDNELDNYAIIKKSEIFRSGKLWLFGLTDGSDPKSYDEGRYQKAKAEIIGLYEGAKAADPNAITIVSCGGWLHYGFIERLLNEDHVPFDILAWHWYSDMGKITNVKGKMNLVKFLMRFHKPLWITETNYRSGSRDKRKQAKYIATDIANMGENPNINGIFIYELLNEPYFGKDNKESHYGLVKISRKDNKKWKIREKKPSYESYKNVILKSM